MLRKGLLVSVFVLSSSQVLAGAKELNDAANHLCNKVKVCIQKEISMNDDIPASMMGMVENMVGEMCTQFTSIAEVHEFQDLVEPATACLNSMAARDCDTLMNADEETQACQEYQKLADKYGN